MCIDGGFTIDYRFNRKLMSFWHLNCKIGIVFTYLRRKPDTEREREEN